MQGCYRTGGVFCDRKYNGNKRWIERIDTLSYREIELLVDMYRNQESMNGDCNNSETSSFDLKPVWDYFLKFYNDVIRN